jgi:hypothetical protein
MNFGADLNSIHVTKVHYSGHKPQAGPWPAGRDLSQVVDAWPRLGAPFKAAILAIVNTIPDKEGE